MQRQKILKFASAFLISTTLLVLMQITLSFKSYDQATLIENFKRLDKVASGQLIIVKIDAPSIKYFKSWPWPRSYHAQLLDELAKLSPKMVAFDVDFSSTSAPINDQAFSQAIKAAKFPVILPAIIIDEVGTKDSPQFIENKPIEILSKYAKIANANVKPNATGMVLRYSMLSDNARTPIAVQLANMIHVPSKPMIIDYSIDPNSITSISYKDIITGNYDPTKLTNKKFLIGSTAIELGDIYNLPKHGRMAGLNLHALAFETLIKADKLDQISEVYILGLAILILTLSVSLFYKRKSIPIIIFHLFLIGLVYFGNVFLHQSAQMILPTSFLYVAIILAIIWHLIRIIIYHSEKMIAQINLNNYNKAIIKQMICSNINGIVVTNEAGKILLLNEKACQVFSLPDDLVAKHANIFDYIPNSQALFDKINRSEQSDDNINNNREIVSLKLDNNEGQSFDIEMTLSKTDFKQKFIGRKRSQNQILFNFIISDITEKMQIYAEKQQSELALIDLKNNDPLTKMPNRHSFDRLLADAFAKKNHNHAVILINLDTLEDVNEIFGSIAGDETICNIAQNLQNLIGEKGTVCRFSELVFAVIYNKVDLYSEEKQSKIVQQLVHSFKEPIQLHGQTLIMSVSIGMAIAKIHGEAPERLTANAVQALDYVKSSNRHNWFIFQEDLAQQIRKKRKLKAEIQRAIKHEEFILFYQPQHDIKSGELIGYESLVRWQDPEKGLRFPDDFIPAAEEFNLISEIGELVLKIGCNDAAIWPDHISVAINVSPAQFINTDIAALCVKYMKQSGLPARRLELEITESMMMDNMDEVINTLNAVKQLGIKIAMDDFGTGYSSLQYMTEMPLDKIKIDRSFTMNIGKSKQADALIKSIVALGHSLDKIVLAEGIEDAEMISLLRDIGCEIGQGYHYGKPMPLAEVHRQLKIK